MAQNKNNVDREQVDNMRRMLANENEHAVVHRYGEDALNSDEYQQAERELRQRRQSEKEMRLEAMGVDEQGQDLAEDNAGQDDGVDQDAEAQRQQEIEIQRQQEIEIQRQQEEAERQQQEQAEAEAQQQMEVAEQHEEQVVEQEDEDHQREEEQEDEDHQQEEEREDEDHQQEEEREHEVQQQDDRQDPPVSEARRRLQEDDRTLSAAHRDSARADREQDQEDELSR